MKRPMSGINIDAAHGKYRNHKTIVDGITFDSKKELKRWQELTLLEKSGQIQELRRQVPFQVIPKIGSNRATTYLADFVYTEQGKTVVEDAKGFRTEVYRIKRKLMRWVHGIEIREV